MKPTGLPPFGNGQQFQMIFLFLSGLGIVFNAINPPPPPPVPLAANTLQNLWKDRMLGTTDTADPTRQFRLTGPSVAPRNRFPIGFRWRKIPSNLFESFLFFFFEIFCFVGFVCPDSSLVSVSTVSGRAVAVVEASRRGFH